jgi:peptidoglycan/LPS O-acetylase OafA/YrhL
LVHVTLGIGLSIFAAWLSWRFFESPILRLKRYFTAREKKEKKGHC